MIRGKRKFVVFGIAAAILCFVLLKYCMVSDEERIKRVLYRGKEAIEKEDIQGVMAQVSRYYRDEYGLNYLGVRSLFTWLFEDFDEIAIRVERMDVELSEQNRSKATLLTWATARGRDRTGYIVGDPQEPCHVVITLEKEGRRWRVIKGQGVVPGDLLL